MGVFLARAKRAPTRATFRQPEAVGECKRSAIPRTLKEGFIRLSYDFMGVIIGEICDMMSDIIGLLSDIIGLWWVLKSKNDTNQKDAQ